MVTLRFYRRAIPLWLICLFITSLTVSVVYAAVTVESTTYGTIGSELVTVTENLTPSAQGIDIAASTVSTPVGDTQVGAVLMVPAPGDTATTTTIAGNYIYVYRLTVSTGDSDKVYSVELIKDGTSIDTLYCQQPTSPVTGEYVDFTWDIGASLSSAVYEIEVLELP